MDGVSWIGDVFLGKFLRPDWCITFSSQRMAMRWRCPGDGAGARSARGSTWSRRSPGDAALSNQGSRRVQRFRLPASLPNWGVSSTSAGQLREPIR